MSQVLFCLGDSHHTGISQEGMPMCHQGNWVRTWWKRHSEIRCISAQVNGFYSSRLWTALPSLLLFLFLLRTCTVTNKLFYLLPAHLYLLLLDPPRLIRCFMKCQAGNILFWFSIIFREKKKKSDNFMEIVLLDVHMNLWCMVFLLFAANSYPMASIYWSSWTWKHSQDLIVLKGE